MQRDEALAMANSRRTAVAQLKRRIARGEIDLVDLLADPPAELEKYALVDVIRLGWTKAGRCTSPPVVEKLGRQAVLDGINLLVPLGRASERTKRWAVANVRWKRWSTRRGVRLVDAA